MAVVKLTIESFLQLSKQYPVLDVRSPGEYNHAHIPLAYNLPLFSDEERKIVGTAYQQQNRETAIKTGLEFFGPKMRKMLEEVESLIVLRSDLAYKSIEHGTLNNKTILVYCWRGGMRSAGLSWLLDLYGFQVYSLTGGYKSFRRLVLDSFSHFFYFKILGGFAGSGKTAILKELEKGGESIIDLEDLAVHKGSAFGDISRDAQPTQEMFENRLAMKLRGMLDTGSIWLEDESQRIGALNIPQPVWKRMKQSPVFFLDIPFEERLNRIVEEYGKSEKQFLLNAIGRIQKRLGGLEAKTAIRLLMEGNTKESFQLLLKYYDKCYVKALESRENLEHSLRKLECRNVDICANAKRILDNQISIESIV